MISMSALRRLFSSRKVRAMAAAEVVFAFFFGTRINTSPTCRTSGPTAEVCIEPNTARTMSRIHSPAASRNSGWPMTSGSRSLLKIATARAASSAFSGRSAIGVSPRCNRSAQSRQAKSNATSVHQVAPTLRRTLGVDHKLGLLADRGCHCRLDIRFALWRVRSLGNFQHALGRGDIAFQHFLDQHLHRHPLKEQRAMIQLTGKMLTQCLGVRPHERRNLILRPARRAKADYKLLIFLIFCKGRTPARITNRAKRVAQQIKLNPFLVQIRFHRKKTSRW